MSRFVYKTPFVSQFYRREVNTLKAHVGLTVLISLTFLITPVRAQAPEDSVVRVFASIRMPNPLRPWIKQNAAEVQGAGVVIEGKKILTNAHVVLYASEVFVQSRQGGDRIAAKVESIGPGIDLATLTLEEEAFFETSKPLPRAAERPTANSPVDLLGFPQGGDLAVTRGVVSRIEFAAYDSLSVGLRIQVDASVAPGNSGGPALVSGKMIGLTYGRLQQEQKGGVVIPNEEIEGYLEDVKDGHYDGKLRIDDEYQVLLNDGLRASLGLAKSARGIMVRRPGKSDPSYPIHERDVLTSFGGSDLDNEGMVRLDNGLRLPFSALIPKIAGKGNTAPVGLIRDGKPIQAGMPLTRVDNRLFKRYNGQFPSYFVLGPLVFSPAMEDVVPYYLRGNPMVTIESPLMTREGDIQEFPDEELVVVTSPMLSHKIARGYLEPFGEVVSDIDGVKVKNLKHFVELVRDGKDEFVTIRFFGRGTETLVFRRKALEEATVDVMAENGIPRRGSEDVMAVWERKPAAGK